MGAVELVVLEPGLFTAAGLTAFTVMLSPYRVIELRVSLYPAVSLLENSKTWVAVGSKPLSNAITVFPTSHQVLALYRVVSPSKLWEDALRPTRYIRGLTTYYIVVSVSVVSRRVDRKCRGTSKVEVDGSSGGHSGVER